jgi:hypothetical protein
MDELDLQDLISKLESQLDTISKSDLSPGVKNDIQGLLSQILGQAIKIKPLYDNIDAVRSTIVDPTNRLIERSFTENIKTNTKLSRKNTALSIIGIIFGLIGSGLALLQFVPPKSSIKADASLANFQKSVYIGMDSGQIEKIIDSYRWARNIEYKNITTYIKGINRFSLSARDGIYFLKFSFDYSNKRRLLPSEIEGISNIVIDILKSIKNDTIDANKFKFLGYEYADQTLENTLRFTFPDSIKILPEIDYYKESPVALLQLPFQTDVSLISPLAPEAFGNNPIGVVQNTTQLLRYLTGKKYIIDLSWTLLSPISALHYLNQLQPVAVFVPEK